MNSIKLEFDALSENEGLARVCVAAIITPLDPTLEEINDVKTAVSEAVTNSVIHGYEQKGGKIELNATLDGNELLIQIKDYGKGISDINQAREPLFTTGAENERSGMGFTFMEIFMDELDVKSAVGEGTTVTMKKIIGEKDS